MKKLLAILLAVAMVMSMVVVVSAADVETSLGTIENASTELEVLSLPSVVNTDETVVVHFTGTTTGAFRYWISKDTWTQCSAAVTVSDTEFDVVAEIVATADGANQVQFKGPSYGVSLDGLNITYCGVFYGTMEEYEEAINPTYNVTVTGGTATPAAAKAGETVTVTLDETAIPEGKVFGSWSATGVTLADATATEVTFTMPASNVTLTAKYVNEPASGRFADRAVIFQDENASWLVTNIYGVVYSESMAIKVYSGSTLLTTITYDADVDPNVDYSGEPTFAISAGENWADSSDWVAEEWAPQDSMPITKLELWLDGAKVDELTNVILYVPYGTVVDATVWAEDVVGTLTAEEYDEYLASLRDDGKNSGYFATSDTHHMILINGAAITTEHIFDANNVCVYCGHYVAPAEDEIVVEVTDPVEPGTEEEEDVTVDVEEPAEDTNPTTGLALAVVPMLVAALAVVITKK